MSTRLDDLLGDASPPPDELPDTGWLWSAGRRRRRWQQAGAAAGAVALIGAVGGVVANLDTFGTPRVDSVAAPEAGEGEEAAPGDRRGDLVDEAQEPVEQDTAPDDDPGTAHEESQPVDEPEPEPDPGPQPDAAVVDAPCAAHEGGEVQAFIDVVAPVDGQRVAGELELVGCASVYEATVRYRLLDAGGAVLVDAFTTATAGGPDIGEFRDTVGLDATGELTLEVFWDSPADGSEADKTTVTVHAE